MNRQSQKPFFFHKISTEACLGLAMGIFALAITFSLFQVFAFTPTAQAEGEKGDAKRGQDVFQKRCTGCHSLEDDKEGPRLRGVFGKKAGTLSATFKYSEALKTSNVTWDAPSLDQWMADPEKIVPNSDMFFRVPRADERTDVIAYLRSLSDQ